MQFAARNQSGEFTGALYDELTASVRAHHRAYDEELVPVAALAEADGTWTATLPTMSELRASWAVSRFQARSALREAGLLEQVDAMIAASDDDLLSDAWASAVEFRRLSPAIELIGAALGLTGAEIDTLFQRAAEIEV